MKNVKAKKPHYALFATDAADAPVIEVGDGDASMQLGNVIKWFDTRQERETDPRVEAWRIDIVDAIITDEIEQEKSSEAYLEKAKQAKAINDGEDYDPLIHDFVQIEVQHTGKDPVDVVRSIIDASQVANEIARQKLLEQETKRVEKREKLRKRTKDPKDPKDPKDKDK